MLSARLPGLGCRPDSLGLNENDLQEQRLSETVSGVRAQRDKLSPHSKNLQRRLQDMEAKVQCVQIEKISCAKSLKPLEPENTALRAEQENLQAMFEEFFPTCSHKRKILKLRHFLRSILSTSGLHPGRCFSF